MSRRSWLAAGAALALAAITLALVVRPRLMEPPREPAVTDATQSPLGRAIRRLDSGRVLAPRSAVEPVRRRP